MIYTFRDETTGQIQELDFEMNKVPAIGATITRGGRRLRRMVEQSLTRPIVSGNSYTSYQLRRNSTESSGADGYDSRGRPMFNSKMSARDFAKRKSDKGVIDMTWER